MTVTVGFFAFDFVATLTVSSLRRLQNSTQKVKKWFSGLRKTAGHQSLCSSPDQTGSQRTTVRTRCSRITAPSHVMKQCFSSDENLLFFFFFLIPLTGVVLSSVINTNPGQSCYLLVLDGKTFKEVGRAYVGAKLQKDMHGYFIPHA